MRFQRLLMNGYSLTVIPPVGAVAANSRAVNPAARKECVSTLQKFRGAIYVADGAIPASALDEHGRHKSPADDDSWHLVVQDARSMVSGCMRVRLLLPEAHLCELQVMNAVNRLPNNARTAHLSAIASLREHALREGLLFGEVGGWAVTRALWNTSIGVTLAVAVWPLCRLLGGTVAVATATMRHQSASLLRRIGGFALTYRDRQLAPFFDADFGCEMQILAFSSRQLCSRYEALACEIEQHFQKEVLASQGLQNGTQARPREDRMAG